MPRSISPTIAFRPDVFEDLRGYRLRLDNPNGITLLKDPRRDIKLYDDHSPETVTLSLPDWKIARREILSHVNEDSGRIPEPESTWHVEPEPGTGLHVSAIKPSRNEPIEKRLREDGYEEPVVEDTYVTLKRNPAPPPASCKGFLGIVTVYLRRPDGHNQYAGQVRVVTPEFSAPR